MGSTAVVFTPMTEDFPTGLADVGLVETGRPEVGRAVVLAAGLSKLLLPVVLAGVAYFFSSSSFFFYANVDLVEGAITDLDPNPFGAILLATAPLADTGAPKTDLVAVALAGAALADVTPDLTELNFPG